MFAHQAIEDMTGLIRDFNNGKFHKDNEIIKDIGVLIPLIKKAHKFHFDTDDFVYREALKNHGKPLLVDDSEYMRLPYNPIWIDMISEQAFDEESQKTVTGIFQKVAILCLGITEKIWSLKSFHFSGRNKKWLPSSLTTILAIGGFCKLSTDEKLLYSGAARKGVQELEKSHHDGDAIVIDFNNMATAEKEKELIAIAPSYSLLQITIKLLNCKNIQTDKIKAPESLNKKRRQSGKQELFDYHVLNVVVPSKKQDYSDKSDPISHNRVHFCRGHFKEYTKEHPLFGRLTGLYWWQPHVRGQNRDGIVMKEYSVKTSD